MNIPFASRMLWCVKPWNAANHPPVAVVNGDRSADVLQVSAKIGQRLVFDAGSSSDPDGDRLRFRWWQYREAGTFPGLVSLQHEQSERVALIAPPAEESQTVHLILEVIDDGQPALTSYRRIVLTLQPGAPRAGGS